MKEKKIIVEINRIKELMSLIVETTGGGLITDLLTLMKQSLIKVGGVTDAGALATKMGRTLPDDVKDGITNLYRQIIPTGTETNSFRKLIDILNGAQNSVYYDDASKLLIKVFNEIPEFRKEFVSLVVSNSDVITNAKALQKEILSGNITYSSILDDLEKEVGYYASRDILKSLKLVPETVVNASEKITLELSNIIRNTLDNTGVADGIKEILTKNKGALNEILTKIPENGVTQETFLKLLDDAYKSYGNKIKTSKKDILYWVKFLITKRVTDETGKVVRDASGNIVFSEKGFGFNFKRFWVVYATGCFVVTTLAGLAGMNEVWSNCLYNKGYTEDEISRGEDGSLQTDRQSQYDDDNETCNDESYGYLGSEFLTTLPNSALFLIPGGIKYLFGLDRKKTPTPRRGVKNNNGQNETLESFKKWVLKTYGQPTLDDLKITVVSDLEVSIYQNTTKETSKYKRTDKSSEDWVEQ